MPKPQARSKSSSNNFLKSLSQKYSKELYEKLNESMTFPEYLNMVIEKPSIVSLSHERVYNMVMSHGFVTKVINGVEMNVYNFFKKDLYGIEDSIHNLMNYFRSSADRLDTRKRILLLHGPVSGAKSTIVTLLKKGLEDYSKTEDGAMYTIEWHDEQGNVTTCEMQEEPLHLIPAQDREAFRNEHDIFIEGEL